MNSWQSHTLMAYHHWPMKTVSREEVMRQSEKMKQMFGKAPKVFRNSSLIYSDEIGATVASMGFKGMLTEGAKHVLGWKSPHYVYHCNHGSRV